MFPLDFPNFEVIQAYREPAVDKSLEKFSWGEPDFNEIRDFAKAKLGWRPTEIQRLVDVTEKRYAELKIKRRGTLENYFGKKEVVAQVKGTRIGQATIDLKNKLKKKRRVES